MSVKEIKKVENKLRTELPNSYKKFQLNYPEKLIKLNFHKEYFTNNPNYLIKINEFFRNGGLPNEYFVIGNDIGGNFFFIKVNESDSPVYYWNHEDASENGDSNWEKRLKLNSKDLNEFSEWLVKIWGEGF